MLVFDRVTIPITNRNVTEYKNKGYDAQAGTDCDIKISDLNINSHFKVRVKCDICEAEIDLIYYKYIANYNRYGYYSCKHCATKKRILTNNINFGCDYAMQNADVRKHSNSVKFAKYGDANYNNRPLYVKTCNEMYGCDSHLSNKGIRDKIMATKTLLYDNPHYTNVVQRTATRRNLTFLKYKDLLEKTGKYVIKSRSGMIVSATCEYGHDFDISIKNMYLRHCIYKINACTVCNPVTHSISATENEIKEYVIKVLNNKHVVELNSRTVIKNGELDIYIPDLKLAIEYNGLYWHSELYKPDSYHADKTEKCISEGIHLIHIYDDSWKYKESIVKSMINNAMGFSTIKINARDCETRKITSTVCNAFLQDNHIQGSIKTASHCYGLFKNDILVSVMNFGKLRVALGNRTNTSGEFELLRFCSKLDCVVRGGATKLLSAFKTDIGHGKIITYADRGRYSGGVYSKMGFACIGKTPPNYYYVDKDRRLNRFMFRKDILVKEGYPADSTEHEIMLGRGLYRIFDSGSLKYELVF